MLFLISFALAVGIFIGLRHFLWTSNIIPMFYRNLGSEASKADFYAKYRNAYILVVTALFLFAFGGWLIFAGIFTPFFKMMTGFAIVAAYQWIKGNKRLT